MGEIKKDAATKASAYTQVDDSITTAVLQALKAAQGRRLSREELCRAVFPGEGYTQSNDRKVRAALSVLVMESHERIGQGPKKGYSYGVYADVNKAYLDSRARAHAEIRKMKAYEAILAGMGGQIAMDI